MTIPTYSTSFQSNELPSFKELIRHLDNSKDASIFSEESIFIGTSQNHLKVENFKTNEIQNEIQSYMETLDLTAKRIHIVYERFSNLLKQFQKMLSSGCSGCEPCIQIEGFCLEINDLYKYLYGWPSSLVDSDIQYMIKSFQNLKSINAKLLETVRSDYKSNNFFKAILSQNKSPKCINMYGRCDSRNLNRYQYRTHRRVRSSPARMQKISQEIQRHHTRLKSNSVCIDTTNSGNNRDLLVLSDQFGKLLDVSVDPLKVVPSAKETEKIKNPLDSVTGGLNPDLSLPAKRLVCHHCSTETSPEWRRGPDGKQTLCNACGLFYSKLVKKQGPEKATYILKEKKKSSDFHRNLH